MTELAQENTSTAGGLLTDMPSHDATAESGHDAPQEMTQPEHEAAAETHASTEHAGGAAGMPQLNPASYPSQLFWLGLTFIMMYVLMSRSVLPRISDVLENRRARREGDLALADKLTREAQTAKTDYEALFLEAKNGANQMIADTEAAIRATEDKETAQLDKTLAEKLQQAEAAVRASVEDARARLVPVAVDVAAAAVKSIVGKAPTEAQLKAASKDASWK